MSSSEVGRTGDIDAAIDAWKARGAHRFEPVQFRFIEALARRASAQHGNARGLLDAKVVRLLDAKVVRLLDAKVVRLLAAHGEAFERAGPRTVSPAVSPVAQASGPLAELVDRLAWHAATDADRAAAELKTLRYFRSTWSRLSADRRLTQSLTKVPNNAGPLNSQHLVHRALSVMRELSPAYLERFMAHVDALLWLDQLNGRSALPGAAPPRTERHRKPARGSSG